MPINGPFPLPSKVATKADVGLANVDNTADANKPVSGPQQTALDGKAPLVHTHAPSDITALVEFIQDTVAAFLVQGSNVTLTYNDVANTLTIAASGGGGGGANWGEIGGTLANQTDLASALAGKSDTSHGHSNATTGTAGFMSAADKTKLDGIAAGATANATDAQLRDRATHTGTQAISTVTGLQTALDSKANADSPSFAGPMTSTGVSVTTPFAMGAGTAIDVTRGLNTKTVSADTTLTFSATPAANAMFALHLTNSSASNRLITIPSSFSIARQVSITSLTVPANGQLYLVWRYTGSAYLLIGDADELVVADLSDTSADSRAIMTAANYAAIRSLLGLVVGTDVAAQSHVGSGGAAHAEATTLVAGFLSAADKTKLNSLPAQGTTREITGAATLGAADVNVTVRFNSGSTAALTVPSDSALGLTPGKASIAVFIQGAGVPTFTGSGATILGSPRSGLAQNDTIVLNHTGIANTWSYA